MAAGFGDGVRILDNQGHILGVQYGSRAIIRHQGRTVTADNGVITIVCEKCTQPVVVFLDTSEGVGVGLATTK